MLLKSSASDFDGTTSTPLKTLAANLIGRFAFSQIEKRQRLFEKQASRKALGGPQSTRDIVRLRRDRRFLVESIVEDVSGAVPKNSNDCCDLLVRHMSNDSDYVQIVDTASFVSRNDISRLPSAIGYFGLPRSKIAYYMSRFGVQHVAGSAIEGCQRFLEIHHIELSKTQRLMMYYNMLSFSALCPAFGVDLIAPPTIRNSLLALSALHPLVDGAFDCSSAGGPQLEDMKLGISGAKSAACMTEEISKIITLLDSTIFAQYPRESNSDLVELFELLHYWQIQSKRQHESAGPISDKDLLEVSLYKGGFSLSIASRIILGNLDEQTAVAVFALGAIYQLVDDWQDICADLREGTRTIYTADIERNGSIDASICFTILLQAYFETVLNGSANVRNPHCFKMIKNVSAKMYVMRLVCLHWNRLSLALKLRIRPAMPALDDNLIAILGRTLSYDEVLHQPSLLMLRV
jgi:hypothetical protein